MLLLEYLNAINFQILLLFSFLYALIKCSNYIFNVPVALSHVLYVLFEHLNVSVDVGFLGCNSMCTSS
jgi:hypothetical protein